MLRLPGIVEHGKLDPAKVEAIAGRPYHRCDALLSKVELRDWCREASWILFNDPGLWLCRDVQSGFFDMLIGHV
jgi:hypothetical protein